MSDSRDQNGSDEGLHHEWLRPRAGRDGAAESGPRAGGGLRHRAHGLRERAVVPPALDTVRARSARAAEVGPRPAPLAPRPPAGPKQGPAAPAVTARRAAPRPGAPVKVAPRPAPGAPIKVVVSRPAFTTARMIHPLSRGQSLSLAAAGRRLREFRFPELHMPELHRPELHRPHWRLSRRQTMVLSVVLAGVVALAGGFLLLVPSTPVVSPGTGSINYVEFKPAAHPPTGTFNFGPYFVAHSGELLMAGSDGSSSTIWSSSDGSNWTRLSDDGAFDAAHRRFVVLGFADDGSGGLVVVGDSFKQGSPVAATAWHSSDGRKWIESSVDFPANAEMIGLAGRPGTLVAGGNGVAWLSQDGTSWTMIAVPGAASYVPRAVRAWAGGFVIVSVWSGSGERKSAAWVSTDGRAWFQAAAPMTLFDVQDAVAYGGGLVAVGSQTRSAAELATPTPKPTPTPVVSGKPKITPKPTPKPTPTPTSAPSGSGVPGASPTPAPTPTPQTFEVAGTWSSPDGIYWFRGAMPGGPRNQSLEAVSQAFDSLVAVGSEPGTIPGQDTVSANPLTLWISDDGANWKPLETKVSALGRSRLIQFGSYVVLAGVSPGGSLSVMLGSVALGAPLPPVGATSTPAFSLALKAGSVPMVDGLKATDTLGPVVGSSDRFYAFINQAGGTSVWTSGDGARWTQQAKPTDLVPSGSKGTPYVLDATSDDKGGIVAVGKVTTASGDVAAVWRLSAGKWVPAAISGTGPSSLGLVVTHDGSFVAAATKDSTSGPTLMASEDGQTWVAAIIPGAAGYSLAVSAYANGFVALGSTTPQGDSATPAPVALWTSEDGLIWTIHSNWRLPPNTGMIRGVGESLIATNTGITGKWSWWWSADGNAWTDARLTTVPGGCVGSVKDGLMAVSPPAAGATDQTWSVSVTTDGRAWQNPTVANLTFGQPTPCRVASVGRRVVVVGWQKAGVLVDFYGQESGL
jgi:hypothetical protein